MERPSRSPRRASLFPLVGTLWQREDMSGPVTEAEAPADDGGLQPPEHACVQISDSRESQVGRCTVRRALPERGRRTVGAWCFADHMGPADVTESSGLDIGPHPHIGLQTVTWLIAGEVLHRDSLGSEQVIRPGQLNLMTAGRGRRPLRGGDRPLPRHPRTACSCGWRSRRQTRHGEPAASSTTPTLPRLESTAASPTVLRRLVRATSRSPAAHRHPAGRRRPRPARRHLAAAAPRLRVRAGGARRRGRRRAASRSCAGPLRLPRARPRRARPRRRASRPGRCCSAASRSPSRSSCGGTSWPAPGTRSTAA